MQPKTIPSNASSYQHSGRARPLGARRRASGPLISPEILCSSQVEGSNVVEAARWISLERVGGGMDGRGEGREGSHWLGGLRSWRRGVRRPESLRMGGQCCLQDKSTSKYK